MENILHLLQDLEKSIDYYILYTILDNQQF